MNRIKFTLNPKKVINPKIEVSDKFHDQIMYVVKEATSLEIDFLGADKTFYKDGEYNMICYTFHDMTDDKASELQRLAKSMAIFFSEAINHSKN